MSEPISAIVLAGGQSRRLGRDKASEVVAGRPLLDWVVSRLDPLAAEFLLVTAPGRTLPRVHTDRPVWLAYDEHPGSGPLAGIYVGLRESRNDLALAVACDMPLLNPEVFRLLAGRAAEADAVIPVAAGYPQVTHALYRRSILPHAEELLNAGRLRITELFASVRVLYVREEEIRELDPDLLSFTNVNAEEDLERVRLLLEEEQGTHRRDAENAEISEP